MIDCPICDGLTCKGGDFTRCIKRNKRASVVAAVLDTYGGVRVVVAHRSQLKHHKKDDEIMVVVPNLVVHEPIGWNRIPVIVRHAEQAIDLWIENNRPNEEWAMMACRLRQLRKLEQPGSRRTVDLRQIVET